MSSTDKHLRNKKDRQTSNSKLKKSKIRRLRFMEKERQKTKESYISEENLALYQMKLGPLSGKDDITHAKRKVDCVFF